jgi:hypothetical protein
MSLTQLLERKRLAPSTGGPALTIRNAGAADAQALARLAELDSSPAPRGLVLLAEVAGEPWAAVSVDDLHAVADPFRPSGELVWLLLERARHLRRSRRGRAWALPRLRPAVG